MTRPRRLPRAGRRHGFGAAVRAALIAAAAIAMAGPSARPAAAEVTAPILIGHPATADAVFSRREIGEIFLGLKRTWPDGRPIVPVVLERGGTHEAFLSMYAGKSPQQFRRYWRQMVFSGHGSMPKTFLAQGDLLAYIEKTEGAVGYVADSLTVHLPRRGIVIVRVSEEGQP